MELTAKERLTKFYREIGLSKNAFEKAINVSHGYMDKLRDCPSRDKLEIIYRTFPELNRVWLLTGEGSMLNGNDNNESQGNTTNVIPDGIPYYKDMPVSAGCAELQYTDSAEGAIGSINIAGVTGKYAFPVVGCSMEPVIHAGDVVVVDELNQWDRIDPDKIYLIITHDDRMIKHLQLDEADRTKVWCVSPNYKRFSIAKTDIVRLYRVTFYGRLA